MIHGLYLMRYLGGGDIIDFSSSMGGIKGDMVPTAFHALARFANGTTGLFSSNVRAGIVTGRREGMKVFYHLQTPCILNALKCAVEIMKTEVIKKK